MGAMHRVVTWILLVATVSCSAPGHDATPAISTPSIAAPQASAAVSSSTATTLALTSTSTSTAARDEGRTDVVSLYVNGAVRTARVRLPATLSGPKAPLVLALHGSDGSARGLEQLTGYDAVADREGFFVAYADGLPIDLGAGFVAQSWNSGECCEPATSAQVDDVGFLTALIEDLQRRYPVDPDRTFVVGHSNGAIMAQLLACRIRSAGRGRIGRWFA
jgi:polyhydroxybutyrate depolymerase